MDLWKSSNNFEKAVTVNAYCLMGIINLMHEVLYIILLWLLLLLFIHIVVTYGNLESPVELLLDSVSLCNTCRHSVLDLPSVLKVVDWWQYK